MGTPTAMSTPNSPVREAIFWQNRSVTPISEVKNEMDSAELTEATLPAAEIKPREVGGREGPDPTRYGDWELKGRCIDF
jgi:hypothetical protein